MNERLGGMDQRLVIQSNTPTADAEGQPIPSWSTFTTVWGRAEYLTGREMEGMQKINSAIQMKFTVRYLSTITPLMRVSWRSESWNIHTILPDVKLEFMNLMASKVE